MTRKCFNCIIVSNITTRLSQKSYIRNYIDHCWFYLYFNIIKGANLLFFWKTYIMWRHLRKGTSFRDKYKWSWSKYKNIMRGVWLRPTIVSAHKHLQKKLFSLLRQYQPKMQSQECENSWYDTAWHCLFLYICVRIDKIMDQHAVFIVQLFHSVSTYMYI